ncbi:hypothetical protein ACIOJD_16855 [Streptomyces sp. NPDC088116]|uniref:hypothetical protein n=1 Tax=Streptomyces sp. NPDC088116 TaxID=3365825 RepID=UPI0037F87CE3
MTGVKALISGAGAAGMALTHGPARYGAQVRVVEPASARRADGQLIDLRGCGCDVVAQAGLSEAGGPGRRGTSSPGCGRTRSGCGRGSPKSSGSGRATAGALPLGELPPADQIRLPIGLTLPDCAPYERTRP